MPRIRTLKPEHRQHRKVGKLSDRAYRLWVSMILEADDAGRLVAELDYLRAVSWPYRQPTTAQIKAAMEEIAEVGLVRFYTAEGTRYAEFPSWGDHQVIDRPKASKLPRCDASTNDRRTLDDDSTRKGREGKGREGKGTETTMSSAAVWGSPEALVKLWNEATPDECPAVEELSDGRRQKIRTALKHQSAREYWQGVMAEFHKSKFLRGLTPKRPGHESFQADLDWLLLRGKDQVENFVKVHEGKYRD